jgi:hypothetical protein
MPKYGLNPRKSLSFALFWAVGPWTKTEERHRALFLVFQRCWVEYVITITRKRTREEKVSFIIPIMSVSLSLSLSLSLSVFICLSQSHTCTASSVAVTITCMFHCILEKECDVIAFSRQTLRRYECYIGLFSHTLCRLVCMNWIFLPSSSCTNLTCPYCHTRPTCTDWVRFHGIRPLFVSLFIVMLKKFQFGITDKSFATVSWLRGHYECQGHIQNRKSRNFP